MRGTPQSSCLLWPSAVEPARGVRIASNRHPLSAVREPDFTPDDSLDGNAIPLSVSVPVADGKRLNAHGPAKRDGLRGP